MITVYTPNSQTGLARLDYRMKWEDDFKAYLTNLLDEGFIDSFRYLYPDKEFIYSWWSYRFNARKNNAGWRIDYFLTSDKLQDKIEDALIDTEILGSDHCPVILILKDF